MIPALSGTGNAGVSSGHPGVVAGKNPVKIGASRAMVVHTREFTGIFRSMGNFMHPENFMDKCNILFIKVKYICIKNIQSVVQGSRVADQ